MWLVGPLSMVESATRALDILRTTPWLDLHGFWIQRVASARFLVLYGLPLLPILYFAPRSGRRAAVILTGLAFLTYVFGAFHAAFYLLSCIGMFYLAERFAIESQRTDVWRWGPPLAAIASISAWYLLSQELADLALPAAWETRLRSAAPWLYPLGSRGVDWEPTGSNPAHQTRLFEILRLTHFIGTAYLVARMLHYFSEIRRGGIPAARRRLTDFLAYLLYAPNLMQGPVERFPRFHEELDAWERRRSANQAVIGVFRIGLGVVRGLLAMLLLGPLMDAYFLNLQYYRQPERIPGFALLYFGVVLHFMWLYLLFAGYCDVAVGMSRILGYRHVENFDWPWISRSFREFWRRWHISISLILRDYIYIPLGGNHAPLRNLVLAFMICGLWHEWIPSMWQWGILTGLLVWLNQRWVHWLRKVDESPHSPWSRLRRGWLKLSPLPQVLAWILTMHAFFLTILVFFGGVEGLVVVREIIRRAWTMLP